MKEVLDTRYSRLPQQVAEASDVQSMIAANVSIGEDIKQMDDMEKILTEDVGYMNAARASERRAMQLVEKSLLMPFNKLTMLWHAETRGRIAERLRLTREITGLRTLRDKLSFNKTKQEKAIEQLNRNLEQQKKHERK